MVARLLFENVSTAFCFSASFVSFLFLWHLPCGMAFTPFSAYWCLQLCNMCDLNKQAKPAAHLVDARGALKQLPWQWETPPSGEATQAKSIDLSTELTPFMHLYPLPGTTGASCALMHVRALRLAVPVPDVPNSRPAIKPHHAILLEHSARSSDAFSVQSLDSTIAS